MEFYGPKLNANGSKYSKYYDTVEVVKNFGLELGRRSDFGQNSQKMAKNDRHPKIKKNYWILTYIQYVHPFWCPTAGKKT